MEKKEKREEEEEGEHPVEASSRPTWPHVGLEGAARDYMSVWQRNRSLALIGQEPGWRSWKRRRRGNIWSCSCLAAPGSSVPPALCLYRRLLFPSAFYRSRALGLNSHLDTCTETDWEQTPDLLACTCDSCPASAPPPSLLSVPVSLSVSVYVCLSLSLPVCLCQSFSTSLPLCLSLPVSVSLSVPVNNHSPIMKMM